MKNNAQPGLLTESPKKNQKFDYTWVIIVVCFLSTMVTLGFCSTPKNQYLDVVTKALDIPRSLFSLNATFRHVATAVVNLFFGTLIQKFGTKKLMLAGMLSLCTAMTHFSVANNLFVFYLAATFMGIGFSFTGTSMVGRIVSKWCHKNRGTVMGAILAADLFGEKSYDKVLGLFVSVNVTGFALGAPFFNLCFDMSGTYKPVLLFGAGVMLFVVIALQFIISAAHKTREKVLADLVENPS